MKRRMGWIANGLLVAGSLLLTLVLAEWAVRLLAPQPTGITHQDRYGLALHYPGITRYLPQFGHDVTFNSVGMRDREHPTHKSAGTTRVLLLGDSFMEALQVPFDSALPPRLERILSARTGHPVEIINAGVSGWGTDDELRYLGSYGLAYQPDVVLVAMTLHNDISDNLRQSWHTIRDGTLVDRAVQPMSAWRYGIVSLKAYIATRFNLYQLWRRVRHGGEIRQTGRALNSHVSQLFETPSPEGITRGMLLTGKLLAAIRDSTVAHGSRLGLLLLPIRYQLSDSAFTAFVEMTGLPAGQMDLGRPQELVRRMADSLGIPSIDLLPAFRQWTAQDSAATYLESDGHWNMVGHRVATTASAQGLVDLGLIR